MVDEKRTPTSTARVLRVMRGLKDFKAKSWDAWRAILEKLTDDVREMWIICGRGAGKSRITALIAVTYAMDQYDTVAGESIYIGVFAPDRKQAGVTFRYIVGIIKSVPKWNERIVNEYRESLELSHGVIIEVITANTTSPRSRSYACAIIEEAAFLDAESQVNPDVELLRALRPGLGRVPGSRLIVLSSPYKRSGILWEAWRKNQLSPRPEVVVIQASTMDLNPTFDQRTLQMAYEEDPEAAASEYGAEFRTDISELVRPEVIDACIDAGRYELPPIDHVKYYVFVDPSGGSSDSFTAAVAHKDEKGIIVVDATREVRPPFSPAETTNALAGFAKSYVGDMNPQVTGDRYGGLWPREEFEKNQVTYEVCTTTKNDLYKNLLAKMNSKLVSLPDDMKLRAQLLKMERRTSRSGKDVIDHPVGGHDDLANAVAGAIWLAGQEEEGELFQDVVW